MGKKTDKEATVYVYGPIDTETEGGVNATDFVKIINELTGVDVIHVRVNTPGGDIFQAKTMQTALEQHPAKIIMHVDGQAASAGAVFLLAGDEVEIVEGGFIMIHNAATGVSIEGFFMAADLLDLMVKLEKEIENLQMMDADISGQLATRTGLQIEQIKNWMDKTTWFPAKEALAAKLVDRVYKGQSQNKWDFSGYQNAPAELCRAEPETEEATKPGIPAVDMSDLLRRIELEEEN